MSEPDTETKCGGCGLPGIEQCDECLKFSDPVEEEEFQQVSIREFDGFQNDLSDLVEMIEEIKFDPEGTLETQVNNIAPRKEVEWPNENEPEDYDGYVDYITGTSSKLAETRPSLGNLLLGESVPEKGSKAWTGGEPQGSS